MFLSAKALLQAAPTTLLQKIGKLSRSQYPHWIDLKHRLCAITALSTIS